MFFNDLKAKKWAKKQIYKNLNTSKIIDCKQYIHETDKMALLALKKIPLLDTICSKILSLFNDTQQKLINMSEFVQITDKQVPKIHRMVKSICHKIGIDMPDLYLKLNRAPNAYTFGTEKFTIVVHSGLLECLEDDELYAVLAHECGHIACEHMLYHTVGSLVLNGGIIGLNEISSLFAGKGMVGNVIGSVVSLADNALELAFYHWSRCSELSADRIAIICCGSASPVIETMMRLAGGTKHIDSEINKELFIAQAEEYQKLTAENKINKTLEFILTKNNSHPLLAVRAYEAQKFAESNEFKALVG